MKKEKNLQQFHLHLMNSIIFLKKMETNKRKPTKKKTKKLKLQKTLF